MEGLDVWKEADKTKKWKKVEFIMPDIVISERSSNEKKPLDHLIAFELKTESPGKGNAPNFNSEKYELDFRKLNRLMRANKIKRAYYLLVYSDPEKSEKVVETEIEECWSHSRQKGSNRWQKWRFSMPIISRPRLINTTTCPITDLVYMNAYSTISINSKTK